MNSPKQARFDSLLDLADHMITAARGHARAQANELTQRDLVAAVEALLDASESTAAGVSLFVVREVASRRGLVVSHGTAA